MRRHAELGQRVRHAVQVRHRLGREDGHRLLDAVERLPERRLHGLGTLAEASR